MSSLLNKLWVEKYRPATIDQYIFQNNNVFNLFDSFIKNKNIPNLLISGTQGCGKTSIARILINELGIDDCDCLRINASSDNGIDNVRDKIQTFCKTLAIGDFKIVLLEEAGGLSTQAQMALRVLTEDFSNYCRFIFTCNYPNKIIAPIQSRCQHIHIDKFNDDDIYKLVANILDNENIKVDNIDILTNHVDRYKPDLRKIINSIQQSSVTGNLVDVMGSELTNNNKEDWDRIWKTKPNKKDLINLVSSVGNNNYEDYYRTMYDNVNNLPDKKQMNAIIVIAEHLYKACVVVDQEINLSACVIKIFD
jgi:DNA polymerase III delta prime subunit